ncbi:tripartite tricarboxylate transporter TctB family protein [Mannheimia sp. AT1]|uniref:Tripartite tricarboxylate transporter TctB family protein n=1 Tax=Mannheimia cairinae TaxID=3025936 RepID=A0ABT5MR67_9PAST|nr:tripartite tricarboxylate transporter TctB family protein [Mannheimia cairinae]MDD0824066.1 tripartite tricarboxylate transporter TctB family protein [Mannheimia cairinae]MDD0827182.1 tripartite tricarboxylate transporter TctB family protein [Mannheimia cairinae]
MIRFITPVLLCIFGSIIAIYSYTTYGDFDSYGAAFFPTIIGVCVVVFSLLDLIIEISIRNKYVFQNFNIKQDVKVILAISFSVLFYIFASDFIGFVATTSLILLGLTLPFVNKNRLILTIFLIILSILIYLLFAKVLLVPLPDGTLFS